MKKPGPRLQASQRARLALRVPVTTAFALPPRFPERIAFDRLSHLPRYVKALLMRIEERARQIAPYVEALKKLEAQAPRSAEARRAVEEFRWMIEEFKVSLFAQELGTAVPVSSKRLDQQLELARRAG